ncbi:MAG TPA: four helix bundle protein [Rhodothermales bacterium]|nr:four helix bundle protein [Rhodothermales bacterium]
MHPETERMLERTKAFGISVVKFSRKLPNDPAGFTLAKQLIRSGTSVGANYREAQRARTKNEFTSKRSILLQEAEESKYWLDIIEGSELADVEKVQPLSLEVEEFIAILVSAIRSAKEQQVD